MFDLTTLIWLFPIAFMLHDFEELLFFEPWLKKNASTIQSRLQGRAPELFQKQVNLILGKTTIQFAFPIALIFLLVSLSTLMAAVWQVYTPFLLAGSLFFLHGFMHLGQSVLLRRWVPSSITSLLIAIPYGFVLFPQLIREGILSVSEMLVYFLLSIVLAVPFILGMHAVGEAVHRRVMRRIG